jgi:hypothetical protein
MQISSLRSLTTFLAASIAVAAAMTNASGQTFDFLGSASSNWVVYAGASGVPTLVTTNPGSITDNPSSGSSYGRFNASMSLYPGNWRAGDTYGFHLDGVVSSGAAPFRIEFTDAAHAVALQLVIVNGASANADSIQMNALGGTTAVLFSGGNFGGAAGVGTAQRIFGDVTLAINGTGTSGINATVSGLISDNVGTLWSGPNATINLGTAPASFFPGVNLNAGASVMSISTLNWTLTPVPEPSVAALLMSGLTWLFLGHGRRKIS